MDMKLWDWLNPFPNDKILELAKFNASADNKSHATQIFSSVIDIRKHCGKRRNAATSIDSCSHDILDSEGFFPRHVKN